MFVGVLASLLFLGVGATEADDNDRAEKGMDKCNQVQIFLGRIKYFSTQTLYCAALNVFSVIKFPNDVCTGQNGLNGTCYTTEECTAKGGSSSGTCASGFGVCCTISLQCGAMSRCEADSSFKGINAFIRYYGVELCKHYFDFTDSCQKDTF